MATKHRLRAINTTLPAMRFLGLWCGEIVQAKDNKIICMVFGESRKEIEERGNNLVFLLDAEEKALHEYRSSLSSVFKK